MMILISEKLSSNRPLIFPGAN